MAGKLPWLKKKKTSGLFLQEKSPPSGWKTVTGNADFSNTPQPREF